MGGYTCRYLDSVKCPKCGKGGQLYVLWRQYKDKRYGPYFQIQHRRDKYDKRRYRELRKRGLPVNRARNLSIRHELIGFCYFGRNYPRRLSEKAKRRLMG